ncbi:MAG: response regulator [Paludibacterium sp.]|uniref:response regulator n=1 Tax=Paludibacterium sp. TaxID=1917523 RepID=UPI0025F24293|nr:response regulator [Paludibacterium sp.]MBV8045654.1 response regulator [Paludibacterium sp.]MBV8649455.1 response regulator [Paludibacterium sp.]
MHDIDVLIVEDEARLAALHVEFVRKFSRFRAVNVAASLSDARKLIQVLKPHLLLLDNFLPDGHGIELLEDIVTGHIPTRVIFITAASDMDTCGQAIRFGAFDYILKPVSYERLQMSLERFIRFFDSQQSSERVNQHHVDELFNLQSKNFGPARHTKGIEALTLARIKDVFLAGDEAHTTESVAQLLGISKTTARRYLEYCVENHYLNAEISYGRIGRPERLYKKIHGDNTE